MRRSKLVADYANTRKPIEEEQRQANAVQVGAKTALNDAKGRLS